MADGGSPPNTIVLLPAEAGAGAEGLAGGTAGATETPPPANIIVLLPTLGAAGEEGFEGGGAVPVAPPKIIVLLPAGACAGGLLASGPAPEAPPKIIVLLPAPAAGARGLDGGGLGAADGPLALSRGFIAVKTFPHLVH